MGATLAAIAAIGTTLALPGLGLLIAGPIAAGLAGAGAGGATGGLIGGLIGAGIPEERVKKYEEGIKQGGIMMGVTPRNSEDAAYFEEDWKKNRGEASLSLNKRLEGRNRMKRTLVVMGLVAVVGLGGCNSTTSNSNTANVNSNLNSNTAPANVGVVQNNNGNQNTSGVRPINSNANSSPNRNASPNKE